MTLCLIPLFTTRFFVSPAFSKPKNVLLRSQFFGKKMSAHPAKCFLLQSGAKSVF